MDNRHVDQELWQTVGRNWVRIIMSSGESQKALNYEMISNSLSDGPEEESIPQPLATSPLLAIEVSEDLANKEDLEEVDALNISYGSIEGFGTMRQGEYESLCSSREVELENQVSELRFQLNKVFEEKKELERSLQASEEHGLNLTTELNLSHKQVASLSIMKGEVDVR